VRESGPAVDPSPFAAALGDGVAAPYRALAVRGATLWAVGAVGIEVGRLEPDPRGDDVQLTWSAGALALTIDGVPADPAGADALERVASRRVSGAYAAHAHRLRGDLWEISVLAL
jgi:hypothetical protein